MHDEGCRMRIRLPPCFDLVAELNGQHDAKVWALSLPMGLTDLKFNQGNTHLPVIPRSTIPCVLIRLTNLPSFATGLGHGSCTSSGSGVRLSHHRRLSSWSSSISKYQCLPSFSSCLFVCSCLSYPISTDHLLFTVYPDDFQFLPNYS